MRRSSVRTIEDLSALPLECGDLSPLWRPKKPKKKAVTSHRTPKKESHRRRWDGVNRREFLRVGSLSVLGLSLADALRAAPQGRLSNCILLWLDGGPSHLDTFDLKPTAPAEVRGEFRPALTNVAGVQICEHFTRLATLMDKVCLIRS